ncbi:MAG: hypothetical protein K2W94_05130 [Alphaproteobacteria bacterium]|nr:hypothetical protein [Alphaproteobacteria bacterium]
MFKGIKLAQIIIILWGLTINLGHCSSPLEDWNPDKENNKTANISSPRSVRNLSIDEPTITLDLAFSSPSTRVSYSSIRSIVISCSNGQILETRGWSPGKWLPFAEFRTRKEMALQIKATDCPVTLTIRCLSTILPISVMREHLHSNLTTIPLKDYKLWREDSLVSFTLGLRDLFYEDGCPKYSCLYFLSSGPELKDFCYNME